MKVEPTENAKSFDEILIELGLDKNQPTDLLSHGGFDRAKTIDGIIHLIGFLDDVDLCRLCLWTVNYIDKNPKN